MQKMKNKDSIQVCEIGNLTTRVYTKKSMGRNLVAGLIKRLREACAKKSSLTSSQSDFIFMVPGYDPKQILLVRKNHMENPIQ